MVDRSGKEERTPRDIGLRSRGSALLAGVPGAVAPCSTLRMAIWSNVPSKSGVSGPGVLEMEVGAVENPCPED